jgi:hypothetical protein
MRDRQRQNAVLARSGAWSPIALALLAAAAFAAILAPARASAAIGYQPDASNPSRSLPGGSLPHGIAVDQASHRIYVAVVSTDYTAIAPGEIDRFESDLTSAGSFVAGSSHFYTGVAVNPVTQGFYAYRSRGQTPIGPVGEAKMDVFSSEGIAGTPFAPTTAESLPQIATDSIGNVYFPNALTGTVQVFDSTGVMQEEISCPECPGGSLGKPVSVALDSEDDLYVVDVNQGRVLKLTSSGGSYSFASVLQSGRGAGAVGVDPSDDTVLVGDLPNGKRYHIVAYDSAGIQFDDFGAGLFVDPKPEFGGALVAPQIAADSTTHKLYVGDARKFNIFERATIEPPLATVDAPAPVGQLTATLRATANVKGHAAILCQFKYTDDADFQAHEFSNATTVPCTKAPDGSSDTSIEAKVSGLAPVTTYHYRVTVTNNGGTVTSGGETFETLPVVASTVTTQTPQAVTETSAKFVGSVNPHGGSVSDCHFEWGTSVSYGSIRPCATLPEPVSTDVEASRGVSGLAVGTTYHYRLVVKSNAGTVNGGDVAFVTATPPPPPTPGTAPPPPAPPTTSPPPQSHPLRCRKGFQKKRVRGKLKCVRKKRRAKRHRAG